MANMETEAAEAAAAANESTALGLLYWSLALALICGLMFVCVASLFALTDLETDALNPIDACRKLNTFAKYEFAMLVRRPLRSSLAPELSPAPLLCSASSPLRRRLRCGLRALGAQALLSVMMGAAQSWLVLLLLPMLAYSGYKIASSAEGPAGLAKPTAPAQLFGALPPRSPRARPAHPPPPRADDTSIFNALPKAKQELFVKLGFYLLAFFLILYHTLRVLIFLILPWTKNYLMSSFLRPFSSTKKT